MGSTICRPRVPESSDFVSNEASFLSECETGDIILWSGNGGDSFTVRLCGVEERWSHIGIVYIDDSNQKCLLESVLGYEPYDTYSHTYKDGVRLSNLAQKLRRYNGFFVAVRKLNLGHDRRYLRARMKEIIGRLAEDAYSQDPLELLNGVYRNNTEDSYGYSCIELVARVCMELQILDPRVQRANNYKLQDFTSDYQDLPYYRPDELYFKPERYLLLRDY